MMMMMMMPVVVMVVMMTTKTTTIVINSCPALCMTVNSRRVMESSKMVCVSLGEIALCKIKKITKTE